MQHKESDRVGVISKIELKVPSNFDEREKAPKREKVGAEVKFKSLKLATSRNLVG